VLPCPSLPPSFPRSLCFSTTRTSLTPTYEVKRRLATHHGFSCRLPLPSRRVGRSCPSITYSGSCRVGHLMLLILSQPDYSLATNGTCTTEHDAPYNRQYQGKIFLAYCLATVAVSLLQLTASTNLLCSVQFYRCLMSMWWFRREMMRRCFPAFSSICCKSTKEFLNGSVTSLYCTG
jgi:hypothetical protein